MVGETLARDGAPLDEGLEGLLLTARAVTGSDPSFSDVRALSTAWGEATLAHLHQVSCEEPLTGLATLAHVRSRLSELHRASARAGRVLRDTHALVVVVGPSPGPRDRWSRALRMAELGELARTVFDGDEVVGRLGVQSLAVVATRDDRLGRRVGLTRTLVETARPGARVWIEGLPSTDDATGLLLDELARS